MVMGPEMPGSSTKVEVVQEDIKVHDVAELASRSKVN